MLEFYHHMYGWKTSYRSMCIPLKINLLKVYWVKLLIRLKCKGSLEKIRVSRTLDDVKTTHLSIISTTCSVYGKPFISFSDNNV